jgi:hypothetical protein
MSERVVRVKDGVLFTVIAPGGFRILEAVTKVARTIGVDLTITSACDGLHSGPDDPHHRGEAYDVRTKDMAEEMKPVILNALQGILPVTMFYCFLEAPGTDNEHLHCQVKRETTYP